MSSIWRSIGGAVLLCLAAGLLSPAAAPVSAAAPPPPSGAAVDPRTAQRIDEEIERILPEVVKIRRFLHMNPELGNREFETARLVASKLTSLGLEVRTGVAHTGVVGVLRGGVPGAAVAVRADMDALPVQELNNLPFKSLNPGIMHACGHDMHTAIALGTAMVLSRFPDRVPGAVKFLFQPAEEGPPEGEEGGAELMIREGVLDEPAVAAVFGFHVWPDPLDQVRVSEGAIMAGADEFRVLVAGRSADGARPHEGVDPIVIAAEIVGALQTIVSRAIDPADPAVLTIGRIEGGVRPGLVADQVVLEGSVRALSESNRQKIPRLMESLVKNITQSYGATYEFAYVPRLPPLVNHPELTRTLLPTLTRLLGKEKVRGVGLQLSSEDFAFYGKKLPSFFFLLGARGPSPERFAPLHSPYFNPDERAIGTGIRILCHLLLDALEHQNSSGTGLPPG